MTSDKPRVPEQKLIFSLYKYTVRNEIKDIGRVIYYFEKYAKFKHEIDNDASVPWEIMLSFKLCGNNARATNMPKCLRWAGQYLVNKIEIK